MATLLQAAIAPILICLFYVYVRDKYEKEPLRLLLIGVIFGIVITAPIIKVEDVITSIKPIFFTTNTVTDALYTAFITAALTEEALKFIVLYNLTWRNKNFNERFDGIVYSVFISLGFASVENVMYVFSDNLGGLQTALSRGLFSIPGHALFGVCMGYYFALAKFENHNRWQLFYKAFLMPFFLHGVYDFILMSNMPYMMIAFSAFVIYLWISGFHKMKTLIDKSPFTTGSHENKPIEKK